MTLDSSDRKVLIKHRLDKAYMTMKDVEFLIKHDKLIIAINRIYYGIFYSISALALKHQFSSSKHSQLIGWFNKNFIKNSSIDKKYGKFLHKAFDKRSTGDYDDWVEFSKNEVEELFEEMKELIDVIAQLIFEKP